MRQMSWPNSRGYHSANHLLLLRSGKPFFDRLLHQIQNASTCIYLQTYIFIADETGKPIIEALTMAAKRGVHVYLTIDAYGSAKLDEEATKNLAIAGVNIHRFQPIFDFRNLSIGRRLHHKIAVFDSIVAIVGGINISNNYNDVGNNTAWLDFAVEVQGEVAKTIEDRAKQIHFRRERTPLKAGKEKTALRREVIPVKMIINDWLRGYAEIIRSHRNSIRRAQKEIIISGSYFLPSRRFRKLLKAAAKKRRCSKNNTDSRF
jgi:cardiolipin synthase